MSISVVIPSYNAGPQVSRLLQDLAACAVDPGDSIEVVVADDGSTDGTDDLLAGLSLPYQLTYLYLPRTEASGRATARNAAIGKASGDVIVMLDADQTVEPGFLAAHAAYHRLRPDLVVAGPRGDLVDGELAGWDGRELVMAEFSENLNNLATRWHYAFSCNLSVRRTHLQAVGGFDEGFRGWGLEDSELGYRLHRLGLAFAFNPAAVTYQTRRHITPAMFDEWRANLDHFVAKHHGTADVAIQQIICRALDPADWSLDWLQCMVRMEFAARGLAGRLPEPAAYTLLEAADADADAALARLPELAAAHDLVVIDDTGDGRLGGPAQTLTTAKELAYFHRPSAQARQRILERYRATTSG
ncbi:glycosyltransferase family 2 protein [Dactylosporangium cerinum]|uniref:Glycosyltransferase family 2 protein n=1 Tax=Dactylosporangium cerinum TaxID=1434730 RepID=A0ABV9VVE8_9ACTN